MAGLPIDDLLAEIYKSVVDKIGPVALLRTLIEKVDELARECSLNSYVVPSQRFLSRNNFMTGLLEDKMNGRVHAWMLLV